MTFTEDEVKRAKNKDLKIWVIGTHEEDFTENTRLCPFYQKYDIDISKYPDVYQKFVTTKEYDEENINQYSKFFNEFAGMYYVWKNNKKSKYVGFSHYRRLIPMSFIDFEELDKGKIQYFSAFYNNKRVTAPILEEILEQKYTYLYEICCTEFANAPTIYKDIESYLDSQNIVNQEILKNFSSFHKSIREEMFASREIFVCKWEEFDKLMRFVAGYVEFIINKYNIKSEQDFIDFYKENIIKYLVETWDTADARGYHFFMTPHNEDEYNLLISKDCGYSIFPTFIYWRVYAFVIEILISVYISSSKHTCPCIIECHNVQGNIFYDTIFRHIEKTQPKNILVVSKDIKLIELLQYYKLKTNCDINFLSYEEENDKLNKRIKYSTEYLYLRNYRKKHIILKKDLSSLSNNIDLIIIDDLDFNSMIIDNDNNILNNLNNLYCNIITLYGESIDNHKNLLDNLKSKYNISIIDKHVNCDNIFFVNLDKKGED